MNEKQIKISIYEELIERWENKKRYLHIQWEGIPDDEERKRREAFNQDVTLYVNSKIDEEISHLKGRIEELEKNVNN